MKTRVLAFVFTIVALFAFSPTFNLVKASPKPFYQATDRVRAPVTGSRNFSGTFTPQRFFVDNGRLKALGRLVGTFTAPSGNQKQVNQLVVMPVTDIHSGPSAAATCPILHLELGPVDLNLLGLLVHLDKVVLDIRAQQGGGILGDLLCSIANLLNNDGPLGAIARLLNQILALLGN